MEKARIYRVIELEDGLNKENLGINWSFDQKAAEDFAENWRMNWDNCIIITTIVDFDQIDWEQTVANMQIGEYEEEFECFLKTNESLKVEVLWAGPDVEHLEDEIFRGNTGNDEKEDETRASTEDVEQKDIEKIKQELLEWIETK